MIITQYLRSNKVKKLNVGCSKFPLKGWLNADINLLERVDIYLDATKRFSFKDGVLDYTFCEHFIEHITYDEGLFFLGECFRILKSGGALRLSAPELKLLIKSYEDKNPYVKREKVLARHMRKFAKKQNLSPCELLNEKMRCWGHVFVYDEELLIQSLKKTGFDSIIKCAYGKSIHEELVNIEQHSDEEWTKYAEILILEARK